MMWPPSTTIPRTRPGLRMAARDDRALSDYIRLVLERHAFGHAASLSDDPAACLQCNASHCDARKASR